MHVTLAIEAPSLADYERALPDGWSSFPQCEAKATLVRTLATDPSLRRDELPAALREVLDDPPPVTAWVPEVHVVGMLVAVHHEHARAGSAAAFLEWMAERNRELLGGAAYAPMLRASTSERLVKNIATAWERLHRGTELAMRGEVERDGSEHTAALMLDAPPGLYPSISSHIHGISFRVLLEAAGGRDVRVRHVVHRPGHTEYLLAWTG
jgi:hypothetical protein